MHHEILERKDSGQAERRRHLAQRLLACLGISRGGRERALAAAVGEHVGDGRVDGVQRESRLLQPFLQSARGGLDVIVEVAARREHFDAVESVRRDLQQVIPREALAVIEMRGDPELPFCHNENHPL